MRDWMRGRERGINIDGGCHRRKEEKENRKDLSKKGQSKRKKDDGVRQKRKREGIKGVKGEKSPNGSSVRKRGVDGANGALN